MRKSLDICQEGLSAHPNVSTAVPVPAWTEVQSYSQTEVYTE